MRIAIAGAGAVGSVIAAYLMRGGHEVSLLARGPHLDALRRNGLLIRSAGKEERLRPNTCSDRGRDLGPQDFVICTAKAHSLAAMVAELEALMTAPEALLVAIQNGIPWWYFYGLDGSEEGPFGVVDPGGELWRRLDPARVVGGVVGIAASVPSPGVVLQGPMQWVILGAPRAGDHAEKLSLLAGRLAGIGMEPTVTDEIRLEVWRKLWGNATFGPLSALTGATLGEIAHAPGLMTTVGQLVRECLDVARAWGYELPDETGLVRDRIGPQEGALKTSTLQDFEAGRPLELDAILAAPIELARRRGVPVPLMEAVLSLVRLRVAVRDRVAAPAP